MTANKGWIKNERDIKIQEHLKNKFYKCEKTPENKFMVVYFDK